MICIEKIPELHSNNILYLVIVLSVPCLLISCLLVKYKENLTLYILLNYEILNLLFSKVILICLTFFISFRILYFMDYGFSTAPLMTVTTMESPFLCPFCDAEFNFATYEVLHKKEFTIPTTFEMNFHPGSRGNPIDVDNPLKPSNLVNLAPKPAPATPKTIVNLVASEGRLVPDKQRLTDSFCPNGDTIKDLFPDKTFFNQTSRPPKLGGVEVSLEKESQRPYGDCYKVEPSPFADRYEIRSGGRPIVTNSTGQ